MRVKTQPRPYGKGGETHHPGLHGSEGCPEYRPVSANSRKALGEPGRAGHPTAKGLLHGALKGPELLCRHQGHTERSEHV